MINVSSISGEMKGMSGGQPAYASSKAAFSHLTRNLATIFSGVGVRVNCIAPGLFPSEMTTGDSDESNKSELEKKPANPAGEYIITRSCVRCEVQKLMRYRPSGCR